MLILRKLGQVLPVLALVSFGTYMLVGLIPGDPAVAILGKGHPPEAYRELRRELGLNDPLLQRYGEWLWQALHGNLGKSLVPPQVPVVDRIAAALPVSLQLAVMALVIALLVSIPLAMWSAHHAGGRIDRWVSAGTFGVLSIPSFLAGLLLIMIVVNGLSLFPRTQWVRLSEDISGNLYHAIIPALAISVLEIGIFTRILRNDLITTLQEDYILAARAKGMPTVRILVRDALRPSSFSLLTLLGVSLGRLIGSTVVVEILFALPGMGSLIVRAAGQGDVAVVQGAVLVIAVIYVVANAAIDLTYGYLDPRIRHERA